MGFKVPAERMIRIAKTLDKASFAINTLERLGQNKAVFLETKKEIHDLSDELKSLYKLEEFDEWKNVKKEVSKKVTTK